MNFYELDLVNYDFTYFDDLNIKIPNNNEIDVMIRSHKWTYSSSVGLMHYFNCPCGSLFRLNGVVKQLTYYSNSCRGYFEFKCQYSKEDHLIMDVIK